jgi:hypothetical protein
MANDYVEILKIKEEEENEIKKNSPGSLPLNPTAQGWSGSEIRKKLSHSIVGKKGSVLALLGDRTKKIATILNELDTQVKTNADDIALKVNTSDIVDDLVSTDVDKPLSANQGKVLNDKKVDKITQEQRDSLGFMENDDRIVPGVDGNLNEMPIKASINKVKNTIVMRGSDGTFQDLYDHNTMEGAHSGEFNKKVDKTQTIIGLDLQDNILLGEFRTALGNATQSAAGLLSAEDKTHLDALVALLETNDDNTVVDTIGEILAIFQNYPEGAELVTILQGKVDKVVGKGLSTNDFTDEYKNKLDGIEVGAEVNPYSKTQLDNMFDDKVDKVSGMGLSDENFTLLEKNKLANLTQVVPDEETIVFNANDELEATNVSIWRYE